MKWEKIHNLFVHVSQTSKNSLIRLDYGGLKHDMKQLPVTITKSQPTAQLQEYIFVWKNSILFL